MAPGRRRRPRERGRGRVARLVARLSGVRQGGAQGGEWCVELVDLQAMDPLVADLKAADIDVARFFEQPSQLMSEVRRSRRGQAGLDHPDASPQGRRRMSRFSPAAIFLDSTWRSGHALHLRLAARVAWVARGVPSVPLSCPWHRSAGRPRGSMRPIARRPPWPGPPQLNGPHPHRVAGSTSPLPPRSSRPAARGRPESTSTSVRRCGGCSQIRRIPATA